MNTIEKLKALQSATPSKWREEAEQRKANRGWLKKSQKIALSVLNAIDQKPDFSQKILAEKMNVSPQYISKLLKGTEKFPWEVIAKLEDILGIEIVHINTCNSIQNVTVSQDYLNLILENIEKEISALAWENLGNEISASSKIEKEKYEHDTCKIVPLKAA